jgi:hypothetical protein
MLRRDLRTGAASTHIDPGSAVTLRNILVSPVTFRLAAHVDSARRAAV